jgi:hypothetical protein
MAIVAEQVETWACRCGATYSVEPIGEVRTRHYGRRRVCVFRDVAGHEVARCGCGRHLHFTYNEERPAVFAPETMPYRRGDGCELCGAAGPLRRMTLLPPGGTTGRYHLARVVYVCGAHAADAEPRSIAPPHRTTAEGTTAERPQEEGLW